MKQFTDQSMATLTPSQIRAVAIAASRAAPAGASRTDVDRFRREGCYSAVGKRRLHSCVQADFPALMARFTGDPSWEREAAFQRRRILRARLVSAISSMTEKDPFQYASAIARNAFKLPLEDLSNSQLGALITIIKRRAKDVADRSAKRHLA